MDKFLIRKDIYDELIEKGYGKKDLSKLTKKKVTDKNGHTRTVYVRNGEQPVTQNQPKAQDELTPEKKARYEEMLEKVKAGPDENALFVSTKGMLNKKDAIAHLSEKLGVKVSNQSADDFLHGNQPTPGSMMKEQQQKIMKDNDNQVVIKRKYGMISLYGAKTGDHIADFATEKARLDFMKENNLSKPVENATTPDIKGGEKTVDRYKELYESGNKSKEVDFQKWLEDNDIVPEEMAGESHAQIYKKVRKTGLDDDAAMKITNDIMAYNEAYKSEEPDSYKKKSSNEPKSSVNGFTLDDIYHHGSDKKWPDVKKIDDMETAKGVVEMIAQKYGATDKGREQLMDFIAYNIGGTNPLYDKLYEEYGVDADDLDMDFEASHDLILNQAMGKDTKKNREQIADSKSDFERRYRQMLEREG